MDVGVEATNQRRECVPGPEGNHEAEPGKEKHPPIHVDGVEKGDRVCLPVDRVDLRDPVEVRELKVEPHTAGCMLLGWVVKVWC